MSPSYLTDIGIPLVVWILMLVVGLELTVADFRRVTAFPKTVFIASVGQAILLPLATAFLIWLLEPTIYVAATMILIAASPGGAISNFYTYLARANIALSVTLTAVATMLTIIALPVITKTGFAYFLGDHTEIIVPMKRIVTQLLAMLVMPVVLGMAARHFIPWIVDKHGSKLRQLSIIAMILLVSLIFYEQRGNFDQSIVEVIWAALLFSTLTMSIGWVVGLFLRLSRSDCFTLLIEFSVRNLAVTAVIGIMVFEQPKFALFGAVFFLVQLPIILLLTKVFLKQQK